MALTASQVRALKAKLEPRHVKARTVNGTDLLYVEGWHVIAEANRIFGYDAWDRRTLATQCVCSGKSGAHHQAAYVAKVQVSVRAGGTTIVREGSGSSEAKAPTPGEAHELALKAAETDATKRALATFGNPFGLALYDREQGGVRKTRQRKTLPILGPWTLRSPTGAKEGIFDQPSAFAAALREAMSAASDIELLFAIWEQNVDSVRDLNRRLKQEALPRTGIAPQLVAHLKNCAVALVKPQPGASRAKAALDGQKKESAAAKIDKSVLTISEPKRLRSRNHLRFVAQQPCLVCGGAPSQAHHIRFAEPRELGLKVSDEFTVPLCTTCHQQNHAKGDEREWWNERHVDPLKAAEELWHRSHEPDFPADQPAHSEARTVSSD